jgi:putative IMPACT (imprinted ancient) family translation regulator
MIRCQTKITNKKKKLIQSSSKYGNVNSAFKITKSVIISHVKHVKKYNEIKNTFIEPNSRIY